MTAYQRGYQVGVAGRAMSLCPYFATTRLAADWHAGYAHGVATRRVAVERAQLQRARPVKAQGSYARARLTAIKEEGE